MLTLGFTAYAMLVISIMLIMAQRNICLTALKVLIAALPMAITGVLDDYQQAYLVIVPQAQA